jgi:hypothetical protein
LGASDCWVGHHDRLHRPTDEGKERQLPGSNESGQHQHRQDQRGDGGNSLSRTVDHLAVELIDKGAGWHGNEDERDAAGKRHEAHEQRRIRQVERDPAHRDLLHEERDADEEGRQPEKPEVPIFLQGVEGAALFRMRPAFQSFAGNVRGIEFELGHEI